MIELERQHSESGLAYVHAGSGPLLLFVHGVGMRAENWHQQVAALSDSFTVVCPDLPGHGRSGMQEVHGLNDYVLIIGRFVEELLETEGQSRLTLCGHSLGALIVLSLAAQLPHKVAACVAVSAIHNRSEAALNAVQQRAAELSNEDAPIEVENTLLRWFDSPPKANEKLAHDYCAAWLMGNDKRAYASAYHAFAQVRSLPETTLQALRCPVLFCTGEADPNSTPEMATQLAQATSRGQALSIAHARHMLPLTHPEQFNQALIEFLQRTQQSPVEVNHYV